MMSTSTVHVIVLQAFLVPTLYAVIKIVAGVLVLKYGKRYADKVKEEENP